MLILIVSKTEPYLNGAILIEKVCLSMSLNCAIKYIEDIDFGDDFFSYDKPYLVYFLTNVANVSSYASNFERLSPGSVINYEFLVSEMNKYSIQSCLRDAGFSVPKSIMLFQPVFDGALKKIDLPLYVKSQKQADIVIRANNEDEFKQFVSGKLASDYYLEECVDEEKYCLEKIYYIDGYVEVKKVDFVASSNLCKELISISKILNMEIYSSDVFVSITSANYVYIDINPSPGLFNSDKARMIFAKYVINRLNGNSNRLPL